ncbi:MAG: hypothetical protein FWE36_01510 [Erysipelotrichales bacterium]|nr:hypothetical protein [Erysipelotrichales bacterium]
MKKLSLIFLTFAFFTLSACGGAINEVVPSISAGGNHSLFLDADGRIWGWGVNIYAGVAEEEIRDLIKTPQIINQVSGTRALPKFSTVAAGERFSIALDTRGNVWTWGWSGSQWEGDCLLGHGEIESFELRPRRIEDVPGFGNIVAISAGNRHSMALDINGRIWTWGDRVQSGFGPLEVSLRPRMLELDMNGAELPAFSKISAGQHSMALDVYGRIWTWGQGHHGHDTLWPVERPQMLTTGGLLDVSIALPEFVAIDNSIESMALDVNGNIWTWGSRFPNTTILAQGWFNTRVGWHIPRQIVSNGNFTRTEIGPLPAFGAVAIGWAFAMAIDINGQVWSWGQNINGVLGLFLPNEFNADRPHKIAELTDIVAISAGFGFAIALDSQNQLWTWGSNHTGQLGHGGQTSESGPRKVVF